MSWIDGWRHRLRVWLRGAQYERDIADELQFHITLDSAQHAASDARRRFGNLTRHREATRQAAGLARFDGVMLDARQMGRALRRSPGFALVAILTLGLGIGTTTAVLSIVDHVLVNSLPFRDAGRLVMMLERGEAGGLRAPSAPTAEDWRRDPGVREAFEGLSFVRGDGVMLATAETTERVGAAFVSADFFPVLGARPLFGRLLNEDDHAVGAPPVAIMSYALWLKRFGGDPAIIGRRVNVDSVPTTVVGVLPAGAAYPGFASLWTPVSHYRHPEILTRRGVHSDSRTLARLRPGVDSARAVTLMRAVSARLAAEYPHEQDRWSAAMFPVRDEIIGDVKPMLLTLSAAAAAVLLLSCANVANLLLARVTTRRRELAVRSALGASRGRLVRHLLTESAVLAVAGGTLGIVIAGVAVRVARRLPAEKLPRVEELTLDHRVLLVAAAASLLTALFCGIWPALRATRIASGDALRAGGQRAGGMRQDSRLRAGLVIVQFSLALVLLVGAGLLLRSFVRAASVDVGFEPANLVVFRVWTPAETAAKPAETAALYTRLIEATRAVSGTVDAAFIQHFPFGNAWIPSPIAIEGRSMRDTASDQVFYRTVSASYLATMRMTMAAGRWFGDDDMRSPGGGFVVNQALAKRYWPGELAIGKRITVRRSSQARADFGQPLTGTIIGVVRDVHQMRQDIIPEPEVYVPYTLEPWPWGSLIVRTRDVAGAIPQLRRAVAAIDPRLVSDRDQQFEPVIDRIASSLGPRKLAMSLIGAFAACAVVLAAIGLYGVIAYGIARRTREMGVRKALGATDRMIASLILRESLLVVGAGIAIGSTAAVAGAQLIRGLLFETGPVDPVAYGATIAILVAVALIASYVPARRATRLDPTIAMRGD